MFKRLLLLLCLLVQIQHLLAQQLTFNWVSHLGGPTDNWLLQLKYDASGNQYVLGSYTGSLTIDSHHTLSAANAGQEAFFVAKYAADGRVVWVSSLDNKSPDGGKFSLRDMDVSEEGKVTVAGFFSNTLQLGNTILQTSNKEDIVYAHLNANGSIAWARQLGGPNGEELAFGIARDKAGHIYLTGQLYGEVQLDTPEVKHDPVAFAVKLNDAGQLLWKSAGGTFIDESRLHRDEGAAGSDIGVDEAGNIVISGYFSRYFEWGGVEFGTPMAHDYFIMKFNPTGSILWVNRMDNDPEYPVVNFAFDVDAQNNIYVAGLYSTYVQYGDLKLSREGGVPDTRVGVAYVLKIGPDGKGIWMAGAHDPTNDLTETDYRSQIMAVHVNEAGRVFVSGMARGKPIAFGDMIISPENDYQRFMAELSSEGKWVGLKALEGNEEEDDFYMPMALSSDHQGNLLLASNFKAPVTLGERVLQSLGERDIFISSIDMDEVTSPLPPKVVGFTLIYLPGTDGDVMKDGGVYYTNHPQGGFFDFAKDPYTIVAQVNSSNVKSVKITLNNSTRIENEAPYALAGDRNGQFYAAKPLTAGEYTLSATPYTEKDAKGMAGEPLVIKFRVEEWTMPIAFTLVDAKYETDIQEIKHNSVLYLDRLPQRLNIRADVQNQEPIGSVVLQLDQRTRRVENVAPYALAGDRNGDYHALMPALEEGMHTLYATAYSQANGKGSIIASAEIRFEARRSGPSATASLTEWSADPSALSDKKLLQAYPNPFSSTISFDVAVSNAGPVLLEVFDLQGRLVKKVFDGQLEEGTVRSFTLDAGNLPNGIYIAKLTAENKITHHRIVLSR